MKRSEVVKIIAEALGQLPAPAYPVADQVLSRLEGPLSIDYDPEEEHLPARLVISNGACLAIAIDFDQDDGDQGNFWALVDGLLPGDGLRVPLARRIAIAKEAVRRWNAWGEIDRLVREASPGSVLATRLGLILDGKEGE